MWHADDGQLNALLDGELSPAEAREVQAHLAQCPECARRLEEARAFLSEAGELLNVLTPPTTAAEQPPTPDVAIVAPRSPGPADSTTVRKSGATPSPVAPTAKEVAVNIDGRTAMTPALRPVTRVEPAIETKRRGPDLEKLAWAASLILCLGVGYLANEVYHLRRQATDVAGRTDVVPPAAPVAAADARDAAAPPPAAQTSRATTRVAPNRPATHNAAGKTAPASKPAPRFTRPERSGQLALSEPASPSAGMGAGQQQVPANAPAQAQPQAPRNITDAMSRFSSRAPTPSAAAADRAEEIAGPATSLTFRRITLEEAVRILSGSIRLIDGMQPARVEAGPGRIVPGADPERDVVRVWYAAGSARFYLDQQLGDSRTGSFNGMMQGDTLVTTSESGSTRVRWVDRKFWLSLTGAVPADSLRSLVMRVR